MHMANIFAVFKTKHAVLGEEQLPVRREQGESQNPRDDHPLTQELLLVDTMRSSSSTLLRSSHA